jgi:hypothetical protein
MLHSTNELEAFRLVATDGEIGRIMDFYFDDEAWGVRFLAVDTSHWLGGRKVLVSPCLSIILDPIADALNLSISKTQLRDSR